MDFATETQTGPSRWTTDDVDVDVDVIPPTTPELQPSPRKWPLPVTLFVVAIISLIVGMNWLEARRKRKLKEWRVARWERRRWGVPVDDERPLSISAPYWRKKRWEEELERRAELKRQAEKEAEEAEERRMKPRFISKAPWAQTKEDKEYLAWKAEKERQKKEQEALETAQTNAQLNAQRSLQMIRQATPIRNTTQERVPIVQIISPRPNIDIITQPTNEKADGEEARPVVPIASRTRPPPAKSALRKNTNRKRQVIDLDVNGDDEKKQQPNTLVDEESFEEPQMPGAFEVAPPKPKPAPQPAPCTRKRPASDDLEQDQASQRKRTKHGKAVPATPAAHEEVTAFEACATPDGSKALVIPRGTKRARSDVGSEFGDKLRVKKKGKKMEEIIDVEMDDQDEPQQQQQLVVSNGARKSKRASVATGKKKLVQADEDEEVMVSTDLLCQGRKIGTEWEIGNSKFKVGLDGKRLRLVPLRTRRKKYEMPIDSVHPDATAMIEVLVDTWLTEEEYKLAREQGNLGWQVVTPSTPERKPGSRRSSMSYSVREDEQLPGKENKLPFPSCSPGSGSDSPGKALMWNSGRIRGVSNTSLPTSPTHIISSIPTTPGRSNRLSLLEPSSNTTKPTTPQRQTAISLSSGGGNATSPARNGGTIITVRQITTTPGGGMPSWSGMQKGRASWARPAPANGMSGRHTLSMLEKREAEARALEKLKARATDLRVTAASSGGWGMFNAPTTTLPAITVTNTEPTKHSISAVTPTTTSLFAPPTALKAADAPKPPLGSFSNLPGAAPTTTAPPSSTLVPPPSLGLGLAASSIPASTTVPTLAPAINISGEGLYAATTAEAPSLLARHHAAPTPAEKKENPAATRSLFSGLTGFGVPAPSRLEIAPAAPVPAEKRVEPMTKPSLFTGFPGFGIPAPFALPPVLSTPNFGPPTIATTFIAPPAILAPTSNPMPTPAPTSRPQPSKPAFSFPTMPQPSKPAFSFPTMPQPSKPAFSFPTMGFNAQQPAAVPPAMESKDKEPPKVPLFGPFPTSTFSNTTMTAPTTSAAVNAPGPFANFGKPGAFAAAAMPALTTPAVPNSASLYSNIQFPQAPGTTIAAPTTGPLFVTQPAPAEVAKPANGTFFGAFNKLPAPVSTGFSGFGGFPAPKPAPEPKEETMQTVRPGSLFPPLAPQTSQPTPSIAFGAPPAGPVPTTQPAEPPKPAFAAFTLPLPKPAPSFSSDGLFGKQVAAFNARNIFPAPAPADGGPLLSRLTPPTSNEKEATAPAKATTQEFAPPSLFGGGFSIKGAASNATAPAPAPAPAPAEPPKRRNGGFFGPSTNAAASTSTSTETPTATTPPKRNGGFFGPSANASNAATTLATTEQPKTTSSFTQYRDPGAGPSITCIRLRPGDDGFFAFTGYAARASKQLRELGPCALGTAGLAELQMVDVPRPRFNASTSNAGATSTAVFGAPTAFKFPTSNSNPTAAAAPSGEQKPGGSAIPFGFAAAAGGKAGGSFGAPTDPATTGSSIPSVFGPFSSAS